ncbi:MAG: hypothetical protein Q4G19_04160 [Clostridia bacterium]|nr:hypothetical protein [Clostridia bacterium]
MAEWYDVSGALDNLENNELYSEKYRNDNGAENGRRVVCRHGRGYGKGVRDSARIRNRAYRNRLRRRFLSMNPAMKTGRTKGMSCVEAIYAFYPEYTENGFFDPRLDYVFNPYEKLYISRRGDIRKYHGNVSYDHRYGVFSLAKKDAYVTRLTNRRIRRESIGEGSRPVKLSYYKKLYGPIVDDLW